MKRIYVAKENARDREREYDYLINDWITEYIGKYKNRRHRDLFDDKINSQLMKNGRLTVTALNLNKIVQ